MFIMKVINLINQFNQHLLFITLYNINMHIIMNILVQLNTYLSFKIFIH